MCRLCRHLTETSTAMCQQLIIRGFLTTGISLYQEKGHRYNKQPKFPERRKLVWNILRISVPNLKTFVNIQYKFKQTGIHRDQHQCGRSSYGGKTHPREETILCLSQYLDFCAIIMLTGAYSEPANSGPHSFPIFL
jgi:hypothetical protein